MKFSYNKVHPLAEDINRRIILQIGYTDGDFKKIIDDEIQKQEKIFNINVNTYKKLIMKNIYKMKWLEIMPKYILIGLIVVIGTFMIMSYWPKLKETSKNKIIASIFGVIAIAFVVLISLLIF